MSFVDDVLNKREREREYRIDFNLLPSVIGIIYRLVLMINVGLRYALFVNVDGFPSGKFVLLWSAIKKFNFMINFHQIKASIILILFILPNIS